MNLNVTNIFFASGISVNYQPVQLPDIKIRNNLTLVCHSGSQNTIYIGGSGLNWTCAMPIYVNAGLVVATDNAKNVWAVMESGYTGNLRYSIN